MVLCVKYRKKLLSDSKKIIRLKEICSEIGERYWFQFEAIGTDGDHVHIFVGSEPKRVGYASGRTPGYREIRNHRVLAAQIPLSYVIETPFSISPEIR